MKNTNPCQRKVVDKNGLDYKYHQPVLDFLAASPHNQIVITDFLMMEATSGNRNPEFCKEFKCLTPYANQLIALKPVKEICQLYPDLEMGERMISREFTEDIRKIWRWIPNMELFGPDRMYKELAIRHQDNRQRIISSISDPRNHLVKVIDSWPKEGRKSLRCGKPLSPDFARIILKDIIKTGALMYAEVAVEDIPPYREAIHSYQFRYALSCMLLLTFVLNKSGVKVGSVPDEKLASHLIDMTYVAQASFYDGIFSHDDLVNEIYPLVKIAVDGFISMNSAG